MQRDLVEVKKRRCTWHTALTGRVESAQIQNVKSCNEGHNARVVQRTLYPTLMRLLEKRTEVENEILKIYNTEKTE